MKSPTVHTIDIGKVNRLLKEVDPYLQNYVRALRRASDGWKRLFQESMVKIRKYAAQEKNESGGTVAKTNKRPKETIA